MLSRCGVFAIGHLGLVELAFALVAAAQHVLELGRPGIVLGVCGGLDQVVELPPRGGILRELQHDLDAAALELEVVGLNRTAYWLTW